MNSLAEITHQNDSNNQGSNTNQVDLFAEERLNFGMTALETI